MTLVSGRRRISFSFLFSRWKIPDDEEDLLLLLLRGRNEETALKNSWGEKKGTRPRCGTTVNESSSKTTTASTNDNSNDSNKNASKDLELPELLFGAASTSFALTVDAITSGLISSKKSPRLRNLRVNIRPGRISIALSRWDKIR